MKIKCSNCGHHVIIAYIRDPKNNKPEVTLVDPCRKCLYSARGEGYSDGYDDGVIEGQEMALEK